MVFEIEYLKNVKKREDSFYYAIKFIINSINKSLIDEIIIHSIIQRTNRRVSVLYKGFIIYIYMGGFRLGHGGGRQGP